MTSVEETPDVPTEQRVSRLARRSQRGLVAGAALLYSAHQFGEVLVPVLIGYLVDTAVTGGRVPDLLGGLAALAGVFLVVAVCFRYGLRWGERAAFQGAHVVRMAITEHAIRTGSRRHSGELTALATGDAQRVGDVNLAWPRAVAAVVGLLAGGVALARVSVTLGAVILGGVVVSLVAARWLAVPLERRSDVEQDRAARASGLATDLVNGLRVISGLGAASAAAGRYRRVSQDSRRAAVRAAGAQAWQDGAMAALTGVLLAVIALVGGALAVDGRISVGDLVAAVGLAQFLIGPLSQFALVNTQLAQARASAARIETALAETPAVTGGGDRAPGAGAVRFTRVGSGSLRDVTFVADHGRFTAVVCADPVDAESILACLRRDVDPVRGTVRIGDSDLSGHSPAAVRETVLVAAHDAHLFAGTLREAVAPGPAPELEPAVAAAGMAEIVSGLPGGMDTPVRERGRSLSGGQRQRVALARALAVGAPVLVLHDPTTAVDAVTEAALARGLRGHREGRTTVLVTTSPTLLGIADRCVYLRGGRVVADDTHPGLVATHADYRELVFG